MKTYVRTLIAAASLALLASCASTGENTTTEGQTPQDVAGQPGTAQPGQEAYSYGYNQAPGNYESYDASGGGSAGGGSAGGGSAGGSYGGGGAGGSYGGGGAYAGGGQPGGRSGQAVAGGNVVSPDHIIYFSFDSSEILPEARPIIESNARNLTKSQRIVTQLEGHTDERGSPEYNIALGERRANAVRQALIAMGVAPQQIRVVSYGEERPAAGGHDEQSYALNRRVEIVY